MNRYQKLKSLLLLLLVAVTAKAQISNGKVYNIVNVAYNTQSLAITSGEYITIVPTNQDGSEQLWYAEGNETDGYTLRSLCSGYYLRSSNGQSSKWTMVSTPDANCKLKCHTAGSNYTFRATNTTNDWHSMHLATSQGSHLVGWTSSASATQWIINEVSVTSEQLTTLLNKANEVVGAVNNVTTYQTALDNLFTDKACTQLKKSFASESDVTSDADYLALPATLQQMVLKVYKDSWAEDNYDTNKSDWDADYAKKYRVQFYEPYNEPECAASALGLNAHTNLNNPTGIFANVQDILYVMVDGEIEYGSALYLASYKGNGKLSGYRDGVQLKQGLNIIPSFEAGNNYCINYVVHTFDTSKGKGNKAKAHKLSDYADLKIHIEGGHINGYWNKMGDYNQTDNDVLYAPDKNADWDYIAARATQTTVTVLGEYITLQFPLHEALNSDGGTEQGLDYYYTGKDIIESSIDEWDNVMLWERFLLGVATKETTTGVKNVKSPYSKSDHVVEYTGEDGDDFATDYGDYYNVHGLSYGIPNSYMYGSWDHCGYHYNTMQSIMVEILTSAGSHWGPAHEIGHQHQGLLNMRGLTEVTNNLFSNVVYWYFGETTSRVNGTEGSLSNVLAAYNAEGSDFFTNNIWAQTHMYYKMFLYYHVLGHNPKFYPRLFEMLRQDPMTIEYNQSGAKSLLHFYKKCCYAAGDDLTEFFRAYGFFRVMEDRFVGDYSNAVYNQTQEEIDAAIKEIKDWAKANDEVKENISVLFINDDTNDEILSHKGDVLTQYDAANSAVVGSYATFADASNDAADYECSVSGNTVTMNGNGGVGYAIFNEKGEIVAFSDKPDFAVSSECAAAIAQGEVTMKAVNADNTVEVVELDDEAATKYGLLGTLLEEAAVWLSLIDDSGTKVGYYKTEFTELQKAYNDANEVYTNKVADSYSAAYAMLLEACNEVKNNTYDRINIIDGYAYRLENKRYSGNSMTVNDSWDVTASANSDSEAKQQWVFEATDEAGVYLIKNKDISSKGDYGYLGELKNDTRIIANATREEAKGYMPISVGPGIWALRCQTGDKKSLNYNSWKGVVGWDHNGDEASYWYITAVGKDAAVEKLYDLQTLVKKTEDLIDEIGYANKVKLQGTNEKAEFYLYCNALYNKSANNNIDDNCKNTEKLLDGDPNTHLHTDNSTSESGYKADDDLDHYLRVDMGAKNKISKFQFTYTTRNAGSWHNHPKTIVIEGCNSLTQEEFSPITMITDLPDQTSCTYTSQEIVCSTPYRYIRFMVTDTHSNSSSNYKSWGDHPYFYMAEFNLITEEVVQVDEEYKNTISEDLLRGVYSAVMDAKDVLVAESTGDDYTTAFNTLTRKYGDLLAARNDADNAALDALRGKLGTLITEVDDLYKSCGSVTYVPGTFDGKAPLQTTETNADFYVWTNAQHATEGPISGLVDGKYGSSYTASQYFFHTDYSGANSADGLDHHITINLGDGNAVSKFKFQYWNRTNATANFIAEMEIYGKKGNGDYILITTINNMSATAGATYESSIITCAEEYDYLRFMVTKTDNTNNIKGGHPITHMAEFELNIIGASAHYDVQLNGNQGGVDNEMMIATYEAVVAARASKDMATSEAQLQKAIEKLQLQKEAFENAKVVAVGYNVVVVGGNGNGGVVYGKEYKHGETFEAAPGLTETDFKAIPLASYTDGVITMNGTTITVIYNKIYTVQVVGLANGGGVVYEETTTVNGKTFDAPLELTAENLSAVTVEGYVSEITIENNIVTVTYKKIYTVNVVGIEGQGGVKYGEGEYIQHGGEIHVLGTLEESQLTALVVEGYKAYVTSEDATITITYKKVYTVAITGGKGNGNVTYNEKTYADGDTIQVVGNIDENLIIAATLVGYNEATIEVDHDAATISATFTMPPLVDSEKYYTLACKATDHSAYIRDNGSVINGHSTEGSLFQFVKANDENGYYIKSYATDKYINHAEGKVFASTDKITIWTIAKHTSEAYTLTVGDDLYLNNVDTDCTDGSCTYLQSKVHPGGPNAGNACSLWTLAVEEPVNDVTELATLISETNSLKKSCSSFTNSYYVNAEMISATTEAANSAQAICDNPRTTTLSKYTAVKESLQTAYNTLSAAKNSAETESQLRANLQTLVNNTSDLMALCGSVTYVEATEDDEVDLQVDQPTGAGYLSANSCQSEDFSVGKLLDNDINSHFHSSWSVAATDDHYLQVYLGEGQSLAEFTFTYTTRNLGNNNTSPAPTKIQVYGSVDGTSFNEDNLLATFTKDGNNLPAHTSAGAEWTSTKIKSETSYRYIRFYVRTSQGPGNAEKDGHYFFAMSSFSLTSIGQPEKWEVVLAAPGVRDVSEDMLRTVYLQNREASGLLSEHTDNATLQATIDVLTTAYGELETAYNTFILDKTELINLITATEGLANGCYEGEEFKYTNSFNVTEDLVEATRTVLATAIQVRDNQLASVEAYEAALADLKVAHKNLQTAIGYANLPVQLTFDANSPVTYKISIARANTPVLAYDESSTMVAVTDFVFGNKSHGWYFMAATDGKVYIMPYHNRNTSLALSTNDFAQDNSKVKAVSIGTEGYTQEWTITNENMNEANRNAGWYNITTINPSNAETTWYFSNHGGVGNKMGFYNDANDDGSRFQFEKADFSKSEAYYTLYNYYHGEMKVAGSNIQGVDAVGYYPTDKANAYNSAYSNATSILNNSTATDEVYTTAYNNLKEANEMLELTMPSADKFYRFVSVVKKDGNDNYAYVYANPADNKMYWATDKDNSDATAIWKITPSTTAEGKYNVTNLHTGSSINGFIYYDPTPLSEVAGDIEIESLSYNDGQIGFKHNGTMMHAQGGGAIVHWGTGANDASAWRIVEVTDEEVNLVEFALTISQYRHAGLYLNYATKIPEGAQVYVVHTPDSEKGTITAEELKGDILPARTAVIVKGDAGTYEFKYTEGTNTIDTEKFDANDLGGSAYLKYQQVETEGNLCCVFGRKGENVGLYKNWVQYVDANGSTIKTEGEGENAKSTDLTGTDYGTHFKISANKVYYEYEPESVAGASAFRFLFKDKEEGTTTIDELILGDDAIIYNLYGQRLTEIVLPGFYIVNGKKVYVNEKMINNK